MPTAATTFLPEFLILVEHMPRLEEASEDGILTTSSESRYFMEKVQVHFVSHVPLGLT